MGLGTAGAAAALDDGVTAKSIDIGYIFSKTGVGGIHVPERRQGLPGPHRPPERRGRRERAQDRRRDGRRPIVGGEQDRRAGPRAEQARVHGREQLLVRVPRRTSSCSTQASRRSAAATTARTTACRATRTSSPRSATSSPPTASSTTALPKLMKAMGAKKVAALAYGISASSTAAAENFQKFAVPAVGPRSRLHQHHRRLRQHRRRTAGARHQERRRRRASTCRWSPAPTSPSCRASPRTA